MLCVCCAPYISVHLHYWIMSFIKYGSQQFIMKSVRQCDISCYNSVIMSISSPPRWIDIIFNILRVLINYVLNLLCFYYRQLIRSFFSSVCYEVCIWCGGIHTIWQTKFIAAKIPFDKFISSKSGSVRFYCFQFKSVRFKSMNWLEHTHTPHTAHHTKIWNDYWILIGCFI